MSEDSREAQARLQEPAMLRCESTRRLKMVAYLIDQAVGSGVIDLPAIKQAAATGANCECERT